MIIHHKITSLKEIIFKKNRFKIYVSLAFLLLLTISLLSVYVGGRLQRQGILSDILFDIISTVNKSKSEINSYFNKEHKLYLDLGFKELQRIDYSRKVNRDRSYGRYTSEDWVLASMTYKGIKYKIKVRLKGMSGEHWNQNYKRSYRVNIRKKKTIFGMREFTLQPHEFRGSLDEWAFMKMLLDFNMIAHRIKFLEVVLNGDSLGYYALEEQYDKLLIENNKRREGPIVGIEKDLFISELYDNDDSSKLWLRDGYFRASLDASSENKYMNDKLMAAMIQKGFQLLEGFRSGKYKTSEIFEYKMLAKLLAIRALLGSDEFDWRDIKFYMNPLTMKLEPIGREIHSSDSISSKWWMANMDLEDGDLDAIVFQKQIFSDIVFYKSYIESLIEVSNKEYIKNFYDKHSSELRLLESKINDFGAYNFPFKRIEKRRLMIEQALNPSRAINAYISEYSPESVNIFIGSIQPFIIKVGCVWYMNKKIMCPEKQVYVYGKKDLKAVNYKKINMNWMHDNKDINEIRKGMRLSYSIYGVNTRKEVEIKVWKVDDPLIVLNKTLLLDNISKVKWLHVNTKERTITIKKGIYEIKSSLIFPIDYKVYINDGVKFNLSNSSSLIFNGAVYFNGTNDNPIQIKSIDKKGGGLYVIGAKLKSVFKKVIFDGLSPPTYKGSKMTGAITFYESDVEIEGSQFINNITGDDYLNIIRSNFLVEDSIFKNVISDAIDSDFSNGEINNVIFNNIGNDAIDFSGSRVSVNNVKITLVKDKAISAGERSEINIRNSVLNNSFMGVISKDSSTVIVDNIQFNNVKYVAGSYQKKPEFGGANIKFINHFITNSDAEFIVDNISEIELFEENKILININANLIDEL
jgi:hypothetical protein